MIKAVISQLENSENINNNNRRTGIVLETENEILY